MKDDPKPLLEHLDELRSRLIAVLIVVAILSAGSYRFVDRIIGWLAGPAGGFVFFSPTEAFMVRLKIAGIAGLFLSVPLVIYEIWRFVGVALTPTEKKMTLQILPASYLLFVAGAATAWFAVIPAATRFLLAFSTPTLRPMLSIDAYVGFAGWLTMAFGAMFQLPLVVLFLVKIGAVAPGSLGAYRRHVLLGLAIVAGVLTPGPDIFSQMALLLPTYLLYEVSILIVWWSRRGENSEEGSIVASAAGALEKEE